METKDQNVGESPKVMKLSNTAAAAAVVSVMSATLIIQKELSGGVVDGEGNGNPLQYSCPDNPMDGGAWWATVHGVTKSWTRLSDFTSFFMYMIRQMETQT